MSRNKGFAVTEVLMILGVVVLLAGVGYVGWKAFVKSDSTQASMAPTEQSAEVITTKADLEEAEKALDELNFEDTETANAETQASL